MGYSQVELANQALDHIGKDRITSLTETSTEARKINEVFARTIHSSLSRAPWSFARKIASLAAATNDWSERWSYKYDIPNDSLRILRLIPTVDFLNREPQLNFELMGGALYCNESPAKAEYVFASTATQSMPVYFLDAVALLLARNIAMPLTRKRSDWQALNEAYEVQLGLAIYQDLGQQPNMYPQADGGSYIDARGAGDEIEGAAPDGSIYWR